MSEKYTEPIKIRSIRPAGIRYTGSYKVIPSDVRTALAERDAVVTIEQSWQNFINPDDYEVVKEEKSKKKKAKASKKVAIDVDGDGVADVVGIVVEEEKAEE